MPGKLDRSGAIEEGQAVAHEVGLGDTDFGAHLVGARLERGVADRVLLGDRALAGDDAGAREDRFHERRLAAREWADGQGEQNKEIKRLLEHIARQPEKS